MRLTWLADVLRREGLFVVEEPGWQSRGLGPMRGIKGILLHHTAGPRTGNSPSLNVVKNGRPDLPGPLSQLFLARDGTYYVLASGRCNHAGTGRWQGATGNSSFIGIEAENTGVANDSPWPAVQMDAYERGVAALLDYLNLDPVMAAGHKEYATPVGRKVDPSFDMVDFRNNLEKIMSTGGPRREVTPVSPSRSMLRKGMSGPSVKVLQKKLGVKEDGHFGPGTELAVRVFQKKAGLTVDGLAGPTTWKAIGL